MPLEPSVLLAAAAGHNEAFERLVREHQSMVFSIAYHYLRDEGLAEEAAQEVFLELFRRIGAIASPDHLVHWLRKVAIHRAIDSGRARGAIMRSLEDTLEPVAPTGESDPFLSDAVGKLVQSLPERARSIVILRYQEEMPLAEIGAMLDMPLNTVKSNLNRALAMLRQKLERRLIADPRP